MLEAVAVVEPRLHWQEAEHNGDTDDKVEIGQFGVHIRQSVVDGKHVEDTVQVKEQKTICETVVQAERQNDGFSDHDLERHREDKVDLLENIDLLFCDRNLVGIRGPLLLDSPSNDNAREGFWEETHAESEGASDDDTADHQ